MALGRFAEPSTFLGPNLLKASGAVATSACWAECLCGSPMRYSGIPFLAGSATHPAIRWMNAQTSSEPGFRYPVVSGSFPVRSKTVGNQSLFCSGLSEGTPRKESHCSSSPTGSRNTPYSQRSRRSTSAVSRCDWSRELMPARWAEGLRRKCGFDFPSHLTKTLYKTIRNVRSLY
jgi:hypothetical protein